MSKASKIVSKHGLFDLPQAEDRIHVTDDSLFPGLLYLLAQEIREDRCENEASIYLDAEQALRLAGALTTMASGLLFAAEGLEK